MNYSDVSKLLLAAEAEAKQPTITEVVVIGLGLVFVLLALIILVLIVLPKIIAPIEKASEKRAANKAARAEAKAAKKAAHAEAKAAKEAAKLATQSCNKADGSNEAQGGDEFKGDISNKNVCAVVTSDSEDGALDPEIVAVITAAISAYEASRGIKNFHVSSIKRIKKHNFAIRK